MYKLMYRTWFIPGLIKNAEVEEQKAQKGPFRSIVSEHTTGHEYQGAHAGVTQKFQQESVYCLSL